MAPKKKVEPPTPSNTTITPKTTKNTVSNETSVAANKNTVKQQSESKVSSSNSTPVVATPEIKTSKSNKKKENKNTTNGNIVVNGSSAKSDTTESKKSTPTVSLSPSIVQSKTTVALPPSVPNSTRVSSSSINSSAAQSNSSSNNETPKKKKGSKSLPSDETSKNNQKNGNVSTSSTTTTSTVVTKSSPVTTIDIATTAQPSVVVVDNKQKDIPKHDPGKDDNSLSAWLCRAYFAIGLLIAWNLCFIIVLPMYILHILFGFDKNKSLMGWLFRYANRCAVETNPFWKIRTFYANGSTKNRLPKKQKKVIFICNHQSGMDPFILISALPIEAKWVAKHIIFKIPIAGWLMSMIGDVPIVFKSKKAENTTTDKDSVTRALDTLRNYLNNDCAVFFFPEGRRSDNPDHFLDFRKGAFVMALQTGADIIPMAISGSHTIWELKHKLPRPGRCAIVVGDPISVKGMTLENDVDNLLLKGRKAIEDLYQIAKKKAKSLK